MSFNTTNYLIFQKDRKELDNELLESFNPYLTMKTFSFYGGGCMINYINDTLNCYGNIFESKEDKFRFFENVIPKQKYKKISYIKSPKFEKMDEPQPIPEFYSKRELDLFENVSKYPYE